MPQATTSDTQLALALLSLTGLLPPPLLQQQWSLSIPGQGLLAQMFKQQQEMMQSSNGLQATYSVMQHPPQVVSGSPPAAGPSQPKRRCLEECSEDDELDSQVWDRDSEEEDVLLGLNAFFSKEETLATPVSATTAEVVN